MGKIICGVVTLSVLFAALGGSLKGRLSPLIHLPPEEVTVCESLENYGVGNVVFDIQYPVISGFGNEAFEKSLNEKILMQVRNAKANAQNQAKDNEDWVFVLRISDDIKCKRGILSVRVTDDVDNGGTGFPNTVFYNADIQKSCWLTLDDLFVSKAYRPAIDGFIYNKIINDAHFFAEDFLGVTEKTSFFVYERQLYITFAKYEIASGMTGEPTFAMPTMLIRKWLRPEYAPFFW